MAVGGLQADIRPLRVPRLSPAKTTHTLSGVVSESSNGPAAGLTTRRSFERIVAAAVTQKERLVVAVLDVDQFRLFKNLHGMAAAESMLRALSRRLDGAALSVGGSVVRYGADEFALAVPVSGLDAAVFDWAEALLAEAAVPFAYRGATLPFSASLGFAFLPDHAQTLESALHCARLAVAQAKQGGGGLAMPCSSVLVAAARGRDELARELRGAIAAGRIVPFYQPVVALDTGHISGVEVLARWCHPTQGLLLPNLFIPLAEEQGLCRDITRVLLQQARHDARTWPTHWRFAFNTTPRDVVDVLALIEGPGSAAADMIDPRRIELEVTETAVMRDLTESSDLLAPFQPRGVKLVLDDFGTGYANFQQLRQIPFARLKIDKSFIIDMLEDERAAACVHAIIQLAHHLGMTATAEGVERAAVAERLAEMGCDYAQGYHYARPMPAAEVGWSAEGLDHAA